MLSGAEEAVAEGSAVGSWALVAGEVGAWMAACSRLAAAAEACRIFLRKVFTKAFDDSVAAVEPWAIGDGATEMVGKDLESASAPAWFLAFLAAEPLDLGCNSACFAWSSVAFSVFVAAVFAPLTADFFLPQQRLCAAFAVEG